MSDQVTVTVSGGVMEIVFNRPEKKNALTNDMYRIWADAMERAEGDAAVRAILLAGEGPSFTAGNDIQDFMAFGTGAAAFSEMQVSRVLRLLAHATKPVVAAAHGHCVGIGATVLLHCDLAYAAEDARISTPFVNLALVPEAASSWLLPAHIGPKRAYAMFALGEAITGAEAVAFGLVNAALPAAEVRVAARRAADALAAKPARALAHTKRLMRDAGAIAALIEREGALFQAQMQSAEAHEAFAAFLERRAPDFTRIA